MSYNDKILDDELSGNDPSPGFYSKFIRYFEGIIRLGFYGYLIYFFIKILINKNISNKQTEIIIGIYIGFILFQFFSINHLIQGIRCLIPKKNLKINHRLTLLSIIGLIILFIVAVYTIIINMYIIQFTYYSIINLIFIIILFSYLIYKEFNNIKSGKKHKINKKY